VEAEKRGKAGRDQEGRVLCRVGATRSHLSDLPVLITSLPCSLFQHAGDAVRVSSAVAGPSASLARPGLHGAQRVSGILPVGLFLFSARAKRDPRHSWQAPADSPLMFQKKPGFASSSTGKTCRRRQSKRTS
jgi:hypothetical protein